MIAAYALTVSVVVNGSVTPNVISFSWPVGSGALAISSSRWFCQKQSASADAEDRDADDQPCAQLVEVLDEAHLILE